MKIWRTILSSLALVLLAVAAAPALAAQPQKQFAAAFPASIVNGTAIEIKVTFFNLTPNGNSYINSVKVFPVAGVTFTGAVRTGTGTASGSLSGGALTITNFPGIGPNKTLDFYITANVAAAGCSAQLWTTPLANTGNSLNGDVFTPIYDQINPATNLPYMQLKSVIGCDGVVDCGDPLDTSALGPGVTDASRGWFNKDGSSCVKVGYDFTNNIVSGNSTLLQWDTNSQSGAAFTYTAFWTPEWVGSDGVPTSQTHVAWYVGGSLITPVPARACLSQAMPAPFGNVSSYVGNTVSGSLVVKVPTSLPAHWATAPTSALSFPMSIGGERLQATYQSQTPGTGFVLITYSVQRAQGGTSLTDMAAAVTNQALALTNPLPLDAANNQMRMCIIDEGYAVVDPGLCPSSGASNPPVACVQKSTKAMDLGDGFMRGI